MPQVKVAIKHQKLISRIRPYEKIHFPFRKDEEYRSIWVTDDFTKNPLGNVDLLKIVMAIIQSPIADGGCQFDILKMQEQGFNIFALHHQAERDKLYKEWLQNWRSWLGIGQPLNMMNRYLGERVTLYFAFLGTHCRWLLFLGMLGFVLETKVWMTDNPENDLVAVFSFVVAIWATCFTEFWKRDENRLQLEWGMSEFEEKEQEKYPRINFRKVAKPFPGGSPVTGKPDYYFPMNQKVMLGFFSHFIITLTILAIGGLNVLLYGIKIAMKRSDCDFFANYYSYIFSGLLSVSISVVNSSYTDLAKYLTDLESHRTDTEHQDSLIYKLFVVKFINSFASLYYVAFFMKQFEGSCDGYDRCIDDLCILVSTILIERVMFTFLFDQLIPRLSAGYRMAEETKMPDGSRAILTPAEHQYILTPYDSEMEIVNRFMDQVIMFGYMVLFVTALPMAPLLGYFSNIVQILMFGEALLFHSQRNIPASAQDIGTFQLCFETVAAIAVFTNSGLVFFTMSKSLLPQTVSPVIRVWLFFSIQIAIFRLMDIVKWIVPDVPFEVTLQRKREKYLISKVLDRIADPVDAEHSLKRTASEMSREMLRTKGIIYDDPRTV